MSLFNQTASYATPSYFDAYSDIEIQQITGQTLECTAFFGRLSNPLWLVILSPLLGTLLLTVLPVFTNKLLFRLEDRFFYQWLVCIFLKRCRFPILPGAANGADYNPQLPLPEPDSQNPPHMFCGAQPGEKIKCRCGAEVDSSITFSICELLRTQ